MDTDINRGEKLRLFGFIALCVVILLAAFWFSGEDETDSADPVTVEVVDGGDEALSSGQKPSFDVVRISRGGTGVIAGRAAPGAIVEIRMGDKVLARVRADAGGEWVAILEEPLEPGSAELILYAGMPGPDGKLNADAVLESSSVVVVSVPERDQDRFVERQENGVLAVLSPRDGSGPSRILQRPGGGFRALDESLAIELIDYGSGDTAIISGIALPRVDVRVYMDGAYLGSNRATDEGTWSLTFDSSTLNEGEHVIRLDQIVGDGDVQLRVEQPFVMGGAIDADLAEGGVLVQPGNTLWRIARRLYGSGYRYTMIFKENSDAIRDPDLIYPGQIFKLPEDQ